MNQATFESWVTRQIGNDIKNIVVHVQSRDGRVDLAAAAGSADAERTTAMTVDTPYFIASVSKMYTAAMIIKLYEQGRLDLDNAISAYLPAALLEGIHVYKGRDYSQQIRVYQLVSQTSGLPDYFEDRPKGGRSLYDDLKRGAPDRSYTSEELMAIVRSIPPKFEPDARNGKRAHYSDTNYHLLGMIIEAVTGKSYTENLAHMISDPLGLQHTYAFNASQARSERKPAAIYFKDRVLDLPLFISSHVAEGGIVSTTAESLVFLRGFFDGKLFDKQHFERMTRQWNGIFFPIQYGYGIMRFKMSRILSPFQPAPELIGHSGSTGSFAFYSPERELYFAGTINQSAAPGRPFRLMLQLANQLK
jgi:D-alanyl-D-alanine carboxypeptidase